MPDLSRRWYQDELMDDLKAGGEGMDITLRELDFINRWLGGNDITIRPVLNYIRQSRLREIRILDLGCGSGEMLRLISKRRKPEDEVSLTMIGIDANPYIVEYAQKESNGFPEIEYRCLDIFSDEYLRFPCDLVTCTLFLHHFTEEQLADFFLRTKEICRGQLIINDLHRHGLAYHSIAVLTRLFSRSPMVRNDAPLSVARGFKRGELRKLMNECGITNYRLSWRWAFRWQLIIDFR